LDRRRSERRPAPSRQYVEADSRTAAIAGLFECFLDNSVKIQINKWGVQEGAQVERGWSDDVVTSEKVGHMEYRIPLRILVLFAFLWLGTAISCNAGMPSPLPTRWTAESSAPGIGFSGLNSAAEARWQTLSFFVACLLLSATDQQADGSPRAPGAGNAGREGSGRARRSRERTVSALVRTNLHDASSSLCAMPRGIVPGCTRPSRSLSDRRPATASDVESNRVRTWDDAHPRHFRLAVLVDRRIDYFVEN
jgi:hypothetical protein